jgi:hypothetical protein
VERVDLLVARCVEHGSDDDAHELSVFESHTGQSTRGTRTPRTPSP